MCNVFKHAVLISSCLLLAGCVDFLAVSGAATPVGGVYKLQADGVFQIAQSGGLNCMIRAPGTSRLYAVANRGGTSGALLVIDEIPFGGMAVQKTVAAAGRTPCHLTLAPNGAFLYTANYSSGSISEFRLREGYPDNPPRVIRHRGSGATPRQKSPHPHFVGFDPAGARLFVCDLGADRIFVYDWTAEAGIRTPAAETLVLPPGSGPRHLAFSPDGDVIYVACELDSTVASFTCDRRTGKWLLAEVHSTLPDGSDKRGNHPGAIKMTAAGDFFFVANRGDNSVAVFSTSGDGKFELLRTVPSGGDFPSDLLLLDRDRMLAVGHLRSGGVVCFQWDGGTRTLRRKKKFHLSRCTALCR